MDDDAREAKAYNSHARSKRWGTWAIVAVDKKRLKFLKVVESAELEIKGGPSLNLYAHDRSRYEVGAVEPKWYLSPSIRLGTPQVDPCGVGATELLRLAIQSLRDVVDQLEQQLDKSAAAGKTVKIHKPRKRGVA